MPITVCLWDPAVLVCSAVLVVVIGGRRLFLLSGSGEGEVSCSCAVRLKCTKRTEITKFICLTLYKHTKLSVWHYVDKQC